MRSSGRLITSGLVVFLGLSISCTRSELSLSERESVGEGSPAITLENYQAKKILIEVPPGNRQLTWETLYANIHTSMKGKVPKYLADQAGSVEGLRQVLEERYQSAIKGIVRNKQWRPLFLEAAKTFQIDPVLIIGAVVGEHTYNVSWTDGAQDNAIGWAGKYFTRFESTVFGGLQLTDILRLPRFTRACGVEEISAGRTQDIYWDCVSNVWNSQFQNKKVDGVQYPESNFKYTFFNPFMAGTTYGLGQLDPIRALMVTDRVSEATGYPLLKSSNARQIYETIIDPRTNIQFLAANIQLLIETYANRANFDISKNPGVIGTLYNLGKEKLKANESFANNIRNLRAGQPIEYPKENFYGFWINYKEAELRKIVDSWK